MYGTMYGTVLASTVPRYGASEKPNFESLTEMHQGTGIGDLIPAHFSFGTAEKRSISLSLSQMATSHFPFSPSLSLSLRLCLQSAERRKMVYCGV